MCQCQSLSIHLDGQSFETVSKRIQYVSIDTADVVDN